MSIQVPKVKIAKIILGLCILIGGSVALSVVGLLVWLCVLWANAEIISFSIIMGTVLLAGLGFGLYYGIGWSLDVLHLAQREEEQAQERKALEDKIAAYKKKHNTDSLPPKLSRGGYRWDEPPVERTPL